MRETVRLILAKIDTAEINDISKLLKNSSIENTKG